jgi:hypothetical protein
MTKTFSTIVLGDCPANERAKKWEDFISDAWQDPAEMIKVITQLMPPTTEVRIVKDEVETSFVIKAELPLVRSRVATVSRVKHGFQIFKPFARLGDGMDALNMMTDGLAKNLLSGAAFFELPVPVAAAAATGVTEK